MEFVKHLLLVLHFVGLASLLGGFLTQMSADTKRVNPAMIHGALTQLVTGVALVGVKQGLDEHVDNAKIGVKTLVVLVVLVLAWTHRRQERIEGWVYGAIGGLTLANIVVAVFW